MTRLFVGIYRYFSSRGVLLGTILALSVAVMAVCCLNLKLNGDITAFFPDTADTRTMTEVFSGLKVSDKFVMMFSSADGEDVPDHVLAGAAEEFCGRIASEGAGLVDEIVCGIDSDDMAQASAFVYDMLPVFLSEKDYERIDSLLQPDALAAKMQENREDLLSFQGMFLKEYIMKDPLGMALPALRRLQDLNPYSDWQLNDGYIFSPDGKVLLCFLTPVFGTGEFSENSRLTDLVEGELARINDEYPEVMAEYFAAPAVGVYNARRIKKDTLLTGGFALAAIVIFMFFAFRRRRKIPLVIFPVLYGMLFALCVVSLFKGSISAVAVGAGAVVLGIALSYSIHLITHRLHVDSAEQLVRELAFPMTVGSFTTFGAFAALLFTSSALLRDLGLFASLTLVGTTVFCLVFLPHFLGSGSDEGETPLMRRIGKINSRPYEKSRWAFPVLAVVTAICLFTSQKVGFNADMMSINYMPEHLERASRKLSSMSSADEDIMFVSVGKSMEEACRAYSETGDILGELLAEGKVDGVADAGFFMIPPEERERRVALWNGYWGGGRRELAIGAVEAAARAAGFRENAFRRFGDLISEKSSPEEYDDVFLLGNWIGTTDSLTMLITRVHLDEGSKEEVYSHFDPSKTVIFDRSFFAGRLVSAVSDDFNLILYVSSFLIFFVLWLSYGRLELALLGFLPMLLSWVLIIGIMGMTGMQFNIVNIILSAFIFGMGDDFSIFIMDGLIERYASGKEILTSHKTAIFFSAFTIMAGMGAMILAVHPALHSIGALSIFGMSAVVLVAFILQPLVFGIFVTDPASHGRPPYTVFGILRSVMLWGEFLAACILTIIAVLLVLPLPLSLLRKQKIIRKIVYVLCRFMVKNNPLAEVREMNPHGEDFSRPAIVVSNHTSYLDIVWMMALSPRLLIVAKDWVRKVPVFWPVAKFLGFYYSDDGYEAITASFAERVKEGWSLAVFPEGTRETDGKVHRFHKGAFYMAETLGIDIIPVAMYGNGEIFPKGRPLNMSLGISAVSLMPRIAPGTEDYRQTAKRVRGMIVGELARLDEMFSVPENPHFRWAVQRSMLYKGAAAEWETRMELAETHSYADLDRSLPRKGKILHLGCGYGQAALMLKLLAPEREITAVDSDEEKIAVAGNNYLVQDGLEYVCADPETFCTDGYDAVFRGKSSEPEYLKK